MKKITQEIIDTAFLRLFHIAVFLFLLSPVATNLHAQPGTAVTAGTNSTRLLADARLLQEHVGATTTGYRHKDNIISWGTNGDWQCFTDCSGFINALLSHSFGLNDSAFLQLFGHRRLYAYHYFDAIKAGNHFQQIRNIRQVRPGDIIALEYADRSEHDDNTGHVLVVDAAPIPHQPSKVLEPNTLQYAVSVIDCSRSGHGKTDTRFNGAGAGPDAGYSGLGKGIFRLYTDQDGNINGYSWSTGNPKAGFDPLATPIVVGRPNL